MVVIILCDCCFRVASHCGDFVVRMFQIGFTFSRKLAVSHALLCVPEQPEVERTLVLPLVFELAINGLKYYRMGGSGGGWLDPRPP